MNKYFVSAAILGIAILTAAAAKKSDDPVLMNVNGKDVRLSEFEYLYKKNNAQQLQPQTLEEYVDMFTTFKLKVADAEAAGIDTTKAFRDEYNSFRNDLAKPYLKDASVEDELIKEAYSHMLEDVNVSHIMIAGGRTPAEMDAANKTLDSLRTEILAGRADFSDVSARYSIDGSVKDKGGNMGWITGGHYPYAFEEAAYNTAVGEISPVVNSGYGLHIIKVNDRRKSRGEVQVQHILKLTRGLSEEQQKVAKHQIDSIYEVVNNGADFSDVARRESQDNGTARNGGKLDWFGAGAMVQQFDSVSFALKENEISKPVQTAYGYHIVKCLGHRDIASFNDMQDKIKSAVENDERSERPRQAKKDQLVKEYKGQLNKSSIDRIQSAVKAGGALDSATIASINPQLPVFSINKKVTTFKELSAQLPKQAVSADKSREVIEATANNMMGQQALEYYQNNLANENQEYANLLNEYRDGILLFEISNRNVWEKASKDEAGLEAYFNAHRDNYTWENPKYKGTIVFATSDSSLNVIKEYVATLPAGLPYDSISTQLKSKFGREVKIERVIAAKGENAIIDYIAFGGNKPSSSKNNRWVSYFDINGHVIAAPEEAIDVKGAVTSDYQNQLEKEWVEKLHSEYPVKVNNSVLKKIK
jgi:peptidyl-prolyl cis-trans isomerase SurA